MKRTPPPLWKNHRRIYVSREAHERAVFLEQCRKIAEDLGVPVASVYRKEVMKLVKERDGLREAVRVLGEEVRIRRDPAQNAGVRYSELCDVRKAVELNPIATAAVKGKTE